jgi:hypothetical protein
MPNPVSSLPGEPALPILNERAKDFITTRLARREPPERIAKALRALFEIEIPADQVVPCWQAAKARSTQTEHRPDKESVQLPADEVGEPLTRMDSDAAPQVAPQVTPSAMSVSEPPEEAPFFSITPEPDPVPVCAPAEAGAPGAPEETEPATQTGHRQNEPSLQIPAYTGDEPKASDKAFDALAELVKKRLGIEDPAPETQTGHRQDKKEPTILTDEIKAFIVRGLARYETPTRVAAAVKANFGIEIDRRQVFAYDPAGSRPPAQRWIDLHAATRAKFVDAVAEIGVAQKVVRLRMLDRFANRADEANYTDQAAAFLKQAAQECGGFFERYQRPKAAA